MPNLKLYYDIMSQPSRAVWLFLKTNNIPFVEMPVALRKGEHLTEEYQQINPFMRVPVIDDGGFILTESIAILKYLCDSQHVPDHWYPKNLKLRAKVDEYFSWQHMSVRLNAAMVFRTQIIEPRAKNIPVNHEKLRRFQSELETTLDHLENVFLKNGNYLAGDDISIADLLGICELMQPLCAGQDVKEGRPKLTAWMDRVRDKLQPYFDEAHKLVYIVRDKFTKGNL